eukprot:357914-Chlamydomonas_euryale.AAC.1
MRVVLRFAVCELWDAKPAGHSGPGTVVCGGPCEWSAMDLRSPSADATLQRAQAALGREGASLQLSVVHETPPAITQGAGQGLDVLAHCAALQAGVPEPSGAPNAAAAA